MIIFDDYEYVKLVVNGLAPPCINRNNVLRSCSKMVNIGAFTYDEVFTALQENFDFYDFSGELFGQYLANQERNPSYKPHEVKFGINEIRNIDRLPKKLEKKYFLYQLFLFKYFGVHRLRVSGREVKRLAGIMPNHLPLNEIHLGRGITVRREKITTQVLKNYSTNKPYTYYYPKENPGRVIFTYTYSGDCFMLPNIDFFSNSSQLWEKFLDAKERYL